MFDYISVRECENVKSTGTIRLSNTKAADEKLEAVDYGRMTV